jgi:hypothetical protein
MSQPQPPSGQNGQHPLTDSTDAILIVADGPADTTVRPARPEIRKLLERRRPPGEQPPPAPDKPS